MSSHLPSDDDILGGLRDDLAIDPSPEFAARVRMQVAQERMTAGIPTAWLAAAAAIAVVALASWQVARLFDAPTPVAPDTTMTAAIPPPRPAADRVASPKPTSADMSVVGSQNGGRVFGLRSRLRPTTGAEAAPSIDRQTRSADVEVVVDRSTQLAIRQLVASLDRADLGSVTIELAPAPADVLEPPTPITIWSLTMRPINVLPIGETGSLPLSIPLPARRVDAGAH